MRFVTVAVVFERECVTAGNWNRRLCLNDNTGTCTVVYIPVLEFLWL